MEEAALLMAVHRIIGGVEVEHDLFGRAAVCVEEERDEQALDRRRVVTDLVIARGRAQGAMLKPVERALARERRTVPPPRLELAGQNRHRRVMSKLVVVEHVFVAQGDAEHPLADHGRDRVLDLLLRPSILETAGKALDESDRLVRSAQKQGTGVRRHHPAVECRHDTSTLDHSKLELRRATVCRHRGAPLRCAKSLCQKTYR